MLTKINPKQWFVENIPLIIGLVFILSFIIFLGTSHWQTILFFVKHTIVDFVQSFGVYGWIVFLIIVILSTITPFPDSLVTFVSGFLFGPFIGSLLSITGSIIGNSIDFWLARKYGSKYVHKKFPEASSTIDDFSKKAGWQSVLLLRLAPNPLPVDWISYAAGISKLSFIQFVFATIIGIAPLQFLTIFIGSQAQNTNQITFLPLLIGVGALGALLALVYKFQSKKV